MADYFGSLGRSYKDFIANPVLLVPCLLQLVALFALFLLLLGTGVVLFFAQTGITLADLKDEATLTAAFLAIAWTPGLIATLVAFAFISIFLMVLVAVWFNAGCLAMVDDIVQTGKTSGSSFWKGGRELFGKVIGYWFLSGLLFLAAALPILLLVLLAVLGLGSKFLLILFGVLFVLLFLAVALFLGVGLFFGTPILVRERVGAAQAMKKSFLLLKEQTGHVILSFLMVVGTSMAIGFAIAIVLMPISLMARFSPHNGALQALNLVATLVRNVAMTIVSIVLQLFLFRMYKESQPAPVAEAPVQRNAKKSLPA